MPHTPPGSPPTGRPAPSTPPELLIRALAPHWPDQLVRCFQLDIERIECVPFFQCSVRWPDQLSPASSGAAAERDDVSVTVSVPKRRRVTVTFEVDTVTVAP